MPKDHNSEIRLKDWEATEKKKKWYKYVCFSKFKTCA